MNRGFIAKIVLIIIALAALYYFFDWNIFEAAESEEGQGTIAYIKEVVATGWYYVKFALLYVWNKIEAIIS